MWKSRWNSWTPNARLTTIWSVLGDKSMNRQKVSANFVILGPKPSKIASNTIGEVPMAEEAMPVSVILFDK
tara:strand:- start:6674 stop:6886 length:213 start_codon:yes stop_codon:yes gene_type:complete